MHADIVQAQMRLAVSSLDSQPTSSVIDEDLAHRQRGHREKMHAVLPELRLLLDQSKVSFVHQRGRLQRMVGAFPTHVPDRQAVELVVDERDQLRFSALFASAELHQQLGDVAA